MRWGHVVVPVFALFSLVACGAPVQTESCGPDTCDGCCINGNCVPGVTNAVCGSEGRACTSCGDAQVCSDQACVVDQPQCGPGNCDGCCAGQYCRTGGSSDACGTGGASCEVCESDESCSAGACASNTAACSAATCPDGCCEGDVCRSGASDTACGNGGAACVACDTDQTCDSSTHECIGSTPSCAETCGGCCDGEVCLPGETSAACGTGGATCLSCGGAESCDATAGQCVALSCAETCTGCCVGGDCLAGDSDDACGAGGASCTLCTDYQACGAGACIDEPTLDVTVTHPFLIDAYNEAVFPSYLAHLAGDQTAWWEIEVDLFCISMTNPTGLDVPAYIEVALDGYSTAASRSVTVPAGEQVETCITPVLDLNDLYLLTSRVSSNLRARVTGANGTIVFHDSNRPVPVAPGSTVFWSADGAPFFDSVAALVMPNNQEVTRVYSDAAAYSTWGDFGTGGYRDEGAGLRMPAVSATVGVGVRYPISVVLEGGESARVDLTSIVGGSANDLDVWVFAKSEYDKWINNQAATPISFTANVTAPAQVQVAATNTDVYYVVLQNTQDNWVSREVQWIRDATRTDVALDYLQAIFRRLHDEGINYINVPGTFFDGAQRVQWPSEMIATNGGNCIDGTVLFASVLELARLEPLVVFVPGHAFVGLWSRAAGNTGRLAWFIETTMIQGGDASAAISYGMQEFTAHNDNGSIVGVVDVVWKRGEGLRPIPR